jgi:membrane associated rhomboid family serine protease
MIPLRDTTKSKTIPFVNYIFIGICGIVFLYETSLDDQLLAFVKSYGIIPARVTRAAEEGHFAVRAYLPLISSAFVHGGWVHLIGNMLYLFIFGHAVEDKLGHAGYAVFYLLCGVGSAVVQIYSNPESTVPLIGASGAIAGVLGAYFILFPRARILTMIPLFVFFPVVEVSAFFFLGFWFIMQFLSGSMTVGTDTAGGGVAWWAHAGGFVVGAVLLPIFLVARKL